MNTLLLSDSDFESSSFPIPDKKIQLSHFLCSVQTKTMELTPYQTRLLPDSDSQGGIPMKNFIQPPSSVFPRKKATIFPLGPNPPDPSGPEL